MIEWELKHPSMTREGLGMLPCFLWENDARSAREQFDTRYCSGWEPFDGFTITKRGLEYPGDPPLRLLAEAKFRDEVVRLYDSSWVAIIQPDGSFEVSRMD